MADRTLQWLTRWCVCVGLVGAVMVLGAYPPLDWPERIFMELAFWSFDGKPWPPGPVGRLLTGAGGAILIGWCIVLAWLFRRGIEGGDKDALRVAKTSLWVWFVVENLHSLAVGAWLNAVLNLIILAGFLVPLWRADRATTSSSSRSR